MKIVNIITLIVLLMVIGTLFGVGMYKVIILNDLESLSSTIIYGCILIVILLGIFDQFIHPDPDIYYET